MYYVYILSNNYGNVLYVGVTNNLVRRVYEHKNNLVEGFTKKYKTHKLVYFEETRRQIAISLVSRSRYNIPSSSALRTSSLSFALG